MRICVYAIAKNEEQFVDRWMASMSEADWVCVLDTGSADRTVESWRTGAQSYVRKSWNPGDSTRPATDP